MLSVALSRILAGVVLAFSHAIGETAPLITIGAPTFVPFTPGCTENFPYFNPLDLMRCSVDVAQSPFTVMPIQIFNWTSCPQQEFHENGAAVIIVLLVMLVLMNSVAIAMRSRFKGRQL